MIRIILKITIAFLFLISSIAKAQDFQGQAFYQNKMKMSESMKKSMDSSKMPDDRKAFMMKMIKKRMEKVYILDFNKTTSTYKEVKILEAPSENSSFNRSSSNVLFKDIKTNSFTNKKETFGKVFLVKDALSPYDWKLGKESKMIGKHLCFKATTEKEMKNNFNRFSRKNEDSKEEDKTPKLTKITAWYTPEIPVAHGPKEYYGLPGLILEVSTDSFQMLCTKIVLNPKEKVSIEAPTKGKEITQVEYDKMMEEKIKEMRERFKSGRKKDAGSRGHRF